MTARTSRIGAWTLALAGLVQASAWGEDIDIYTTGAGAGAAPNVLIFLDNTSNWSSAAQEWSYCGVVAKCGADTKCLSYAKTIFPGYASANCNGNGNNKKDVTQKQGSVEAGALMVVLNELICQAAKPINVNVGLMTYQPNGAPSGTAFGGNGEVGTYIRHAVKPLVKGGTYCNTLTSDLKSILDDINSPPYKGPSSVNYGTGFYEAFKYFGGYTNPAHAINDAPTVPNDGQGTPVNNTHFGPARNSALSGYEDAEAFTDAGKSTYKSPISVDSICGANNYLLLVGNFWPNAGTPSLLSSNLQYGFTATSFPSCQAGRVADKWANFLSITDISGYAPGEQPLFSYAINVYNKTADACQTALLKSIAKNGGGGSGGYYEVGGDLGKLVTSFKDFFTTIAAVNSVFAASSLPVSVNTQGTYLNQVFIGMFRPDEKAHENWVGNLKQYEFALDETVTPPSLYLADALGNPAIDNANTGFIKQCAVSFWTKDTSAFYTNGNVKTAYWENVLPSSLAQPTGCSAPPAPYSDASEASDWPDGNLVERGGAGQWLRGLDCGPGKSPTYCGRHIQTCASSDPATCVKGAEKDFNANAVTLANSSSTSADLINWVAGGNLGDGPKSDAGLYELYNPVNAALAGKARPTAHGPVVHSRPLAINYGTDKAPDVVVYYGAGDGLLRALDGNQSGATAGQELWAFAAPEFFPSAKLKVLDRLREDKPLISYPGITMDLTPTPAKRDYFFDGSIGAYEEINDNSEITKLYIYPTMRRGGRMVYAFDATQRPKDSTLPKLMWRFGCPNATNSDTAWNDTNCVGADAKSLGQTWSMPRTLKLKGDATLYAVFGGGYDNLCEDVDPPAWPKLDCADRRGAGIFVLDGFSGAQLRYIDLKALFPAYGAGSIAADVSPVDMNGDGYADLLYAADTRGNVWRIVVSDINSTYAGLKSADWTVARLAHVSDWSNANDPRKMRRFMYAPNVVPVGGTAMVLVGTGDREHPLSLLDYSKNPATEYPVQPSKVLNQFYGFRDRPKRASWQIDGTCDDPPGDLVTNCDLLNVSDTKLDYSVNPHGWMIDLDRNATDSVKEQVVTTAVTFTGKTFFSTFQPTDPTKASAQCSNLGTARGYAMDFLTGETELLSTGERDQRSAKFTGGGIPPSPVAGVVEVGNKLVPFTLGAKSNVPSSALEGGKAPVEITSSRRLIYRQWEVDKK